MGGFARRSSMGVAGHELSWHGRYMLDLLRQRGQDYARIARPMLVYGLGAGLWLAEFAAVAQRSWPRLRQLIAGAMPQNTPVCGNPQCDFSMFWPAGRVARAHQFATLYQPMQLLAVRQHMLTMAAQCLEYIYPPPTLLLSLPVSYLPFNAGAMVWLAALTGVSAILLRWAGLSWPVLLAVLLCPATLWNYECMQISLLAASLLIAGLLRMGDAPWRAGGLLGLLIIKPQVGLLVVVALLATRNLRALLGAALAALTLSALVTALLGPGVWTAYIHYGPAVASMVLDAKLVLQSYETFGVSTFWMVRSLGGTVHLAGLLQALSTLAAAAVCWRIWRGQASLARKFAVTGWAALLATPYGYTYDMIAASAGLALLAEAQRWRIGFLEPLFWMSPILSPIIANATGLELAPLVIAAAVAWICYAAPARYSSGSGAAYSTAMK